MPWPSPATPVHPKRSAAPVKTAARRASSRLRRRNSTGSRPRRCASSSICDSRAKLLAVAASARYEAWSNGLAAGRYSRRWFATSYGIAIAAGPELMLVNVQALSVPSGAAALSTSITAAGRSMPDVNSSWRDHETLTGPPTSRARTAASRATPPPCLPPNPPPVGGTITRTRSSATSSSAATCARVANGVWVPTQIVRRPSSSQIASAARVSSAAGAM